MGPRQHRGLRRRSEPRDNLRSVGRRPESRDTYGDALREGPLPSRDHREWRRPSPDDARGRREVHGSPARRAGAESRSDQRASGCADATAARSGRRGENQDHCGGTRHDSQFADGGRHDDSDAPVGSERSGAFGGHPASDRVRPHRGNALRSADARETRARRVRACRSAPPNESARIRCA